MKQNKKGFTVIEVVLVLAIAGLIFAMAFIGLPALQRIQRNTQRKEDAQRVFAAMLEYQKNNNKLPFKIENISGKSNVADVTLDQNFVSRYIDSNCEIRSQQNNYAFIYYKNCGKEFTTPTGANYALCTHDTSTSYYGSSYAYGPCINENYSYNSASYVIEVLPYSDCNYSRGRYKPTNFTVRMILEGGMTYCLDNS